MKEGIGCLRERRLTMKIEMGLGTFIATIAITYLAGQAVGCIKTTIFNAVCDDLQTT